MAVGRTVCYILVGLSLCLAWSVYNHHAPWGSEPIKTKLFGWIAVKYWDLGMLGAKYGLWSKVSAARSLSIFYNSKQNMVQEARTEIAGVPVVIYYPNKRTGKDVGIVNYHGGGWILASADYLGLSMARYAVELGAVVVSVEYPLAPKVKPLKIHDSCFQVTKYFIQHAESWGVDPSKIIITGDSAGGNLAASVNLHLRDENIQPMPILQVLQYGIFQLVDLDLPSYIQNSEGPNLAKYMLSFCYSGFLTGDVDKYDDVIRRNRHVPLSIRKNLLKYVNHDIIPPEQQYPPYQPPTYEVDEEGLEFWKEYGDIVLNPYISPLFAESHQNLSEAYIITGQHDLIRDESFLYAHRLREDAVNVTFYNSPVGLHVINNLFNDLKDGEHDMKAMISFIKRRLDDNETPSIK